MERNGGSLTIPVSGMNRGRFAHFFESACALVRGMEWLAVRHEKMALKEANRIFIVWRGEPRFDSRWLLQKVSFMWEGPAHELLERLSMFFGFSFREVGARPEEPLVVE